MDSVNGYSVAGLDLNPSSNLLLPPMRLCGVIGPMWCFVMTGKLSLISVKVCFFARTEWPRIELSEQAEFNVFSLQSCKGKKNKYLM